MILGPTVRGQTQSYNYFLSHPPTHNVGMKYIAVSIFQFFLTHLRSSSGEKICDGRVNIVCYIVNIGADWITVLTEWEKLLNCHLSDDIF